MAIHRIWNDAMNWSGLNGYGLNPRIKWIEEWYVQDNKFSPSECPNIKIYMPIKS